MADFVNIAKLRANKIRSALGLGNDPISNIFQLLESEGIYLFSKRLNGKASAMFMRNQGFHLVVINSSNTLGHQIFSAAHEFSHYLFDKDLMWSACIVNKYNQQNENERLADLFASFFLMPEEGIFNHLDKRGVKNFVNLSIEDIISLQQYFNVSWSAMLYRLKNIGLIGQSNFDELKNIGIIKEASLLGYSIDIYQVPERDIISQKYIEKVITLYKKDEISERKKDEYLKLVGINNEFFLNSEMNKSEEDYYD